MANDMSALAQLGEVYGSIDISLEGTFSVRRFDAVKRFKHTDDHPYDEALTEAKAYLHSLELAMR